MNQVDMSGEGAGLRWSGGTVIAPPTPRRPFWPAREGAFWVAVALAVPKIVGTIATVLLRRALGPGVAGIFDLAYAPYQFLNGFRTIGTGPALVYQRELDEALVGTAWTLNLITAVVVALAAQLVAHPLAVYYGHPAIEGIFRWLSVAYILGSLGSVQYFLLLRDRNFRSRTIPAVSQSIAAGGVAILFALWGFGVGALIARELTSAAVGTAVLWAIYPLRPHLRLLSAPARQLLRYGIWVSAGMTLFFLSQNIDVVIGGRIIHSAAAIGFYGTSWSLAFVVAGILTVVAGSMVFPTLSRLRHDPAAFRASLLQSIEQITLVMLPAAVLLAVLAPVLIVPLLGVKWAAYRSFWPVLSLLALYAGNRTVLAVFFEAYKAAGKPWLVLVYNAIKLALMIPAIIVGAQHGILGLAVAYLPVQAIEFPLALILIRRILGIGPAALARAVSTPLIATTIAAAATIAVEFTLRYQRHWHDAHTLIVSGLLGVAVYLAAIVILDRGLLRESGRILLRGL